MKGYRCAICGVGVSSSDGSKPTLIKWDDGHECDFKEVKHKLNGG